MLRQYTVLLLRYWSQHGSFTAGGPQVAYLCISVGAIDFHSCNAVELYFCAKFVFSTIKHNTTLQGW